MVTRKSPFSKQFFLFKIYAPNNLERSTPKNHWMEYVKPRNDGMDCWWFVSWLAGVIGIPCHSLLQSSICGYEILKNQYLGKLHPPKFDMDTKENDSISKLESGCCFFFEWFIRGHLYYQRKQCTITREIIQSYHTFALFDVPKGK